MALGRNWTRDRIWDKADESTTGLGAQTGMWENILGTLYGIDVQKQADLGLQHKRDKDADRSLSGTAYSAEELGLDMSKPNNTREEVKSAINRLLTKEKKTTRDRIRSDKKEDFQMEATQRRLEAEQANLQQLKILGMQNQASQTQWLRQMEYMDKKEEAKLEEAQLEALIAGLASLGANLI